MAVSVTPIRDTKWLTLEVCREFQRGTCSRPDTECKFAHPSKSCQVENGRVIACFDSLKVSKYYIIFKDIQLMKAAVVAKRNPAAWKGAIAGCQQWDVLLLLFYWCLLICFAVFLRGRGRIGGMKGKYAWQGSDPPVWLQWLVLCLQIILCL